MSGVKGRSFGPDVKALIRKLLVGYPLYFHNDVLNSEGRKIFEELARMLIYEHPEYKPLIRRARRSREVKDILRIARLVIGDKADELLMMGIWGLYKEYLTNFKNIQLNKRDRVNQES